MHPLNPDPTMVPETRNPQPSTLTLHPAQVERPVGVAALHFEVIGDSVCAAQLHGEIFSFFGAGFRVLDFRVDVQAQVLAAGPLWGPSLATPHIHFVSGGATD